MMLIFIMTSLLNFGHLVISLVFSYCFNKLPQIQWIKTTQIYYRTALYVKSQSDENQSVGRAVLPLYTLGKRSFPCLFKLLEAGKTFIDSWPTSSIFKASNTVSLWPFSCAQHLPLVIGEKDSPLLRICMIILGVPG